ncbi:S1 family peptidase [Rhodococcus sp. ARC_M13]|uniref:S1 family peptidase n=1 Tax=Rhodococcus TaxID=1827 RepID=UPI00061B88E7|nr:MULTISPECIES: S1 family peptidase [Rhodococcus]AKD96467.1 protease [Rhodococcus erythropolis]MBF7736800.1 protease [Rhodococcus erythropolis]MBS2990642.1 protease [Rhodococcus erythropolis]MCJ0899672.1 S1 family peptidase [Rhodococcus sp. ARC_M13]MCZ4644154.1 S1 family peptidase [Rhodococcus erythropolis]
MRNSLAIRTAVVGASALLLAAPFTTTASAEPASDTHVEQLEADQLPAELVEAITRDLKISPQEYLDRAAKAQELGAYAQEFKSERPGDYAGSWMGLDGQPVVAVTTTEAARIAADDGYRTHVAPVSADTLEKTLADVNGWIAGLPKEISRAVNSATIDVLNNQVVIDVANSPVGQALNLPTLLENTKIVLSPDGGGSVDPGALGGDTYITSTGPIRETPTENISVCSFGFNAVDDQNNALNISAGHCNPAEGSKSPVYLPNHANVDDSRLIGAFSQSSVGNNAGDLDYSVIKFDQSGIDAGLDRAAVRGANGTTLAITGTARPVIGAPICKSGQTSSFTCGVVAADRVETQLVMADGDSRTVRGFAGTACTLAGDSGGAIVSGTLALGITSGSNSSGAPSCNEANLVLATSGGTSNLGIPVGDILDAADRASGGGVGSGIRVRTAG